MIRLLGQRAQFRAMGIVPGTSRHPKDVPSVSFGGGRTVWAQLKEE